MILNQTFLLPLLDSIRVPSSILMWVSSSHRRRTQMILNQMFFCCYCWTWCEFRVCTKDEFSYDSKSNFSIAIAGLTWVLSSEFCEFRVLIKRNSAMILNIFLLTWLDMMRVPSSTLMRIPSFTLIRVLSSHQRIIQLWF